MPQWSPCKRSAVVRRLRQLGFEGLFSGGKHQYMTLGKQRLTIPSNAEYSVPQVRMLLREVATMIGRPVTVEEWNELK